MTSITWKDGGPLMVGGAIGGSESCCCENPPPPVCVCSDGCTLFAELSSPEDIAVKTAPRSCVPPFGEVLVSRTVPGHPFTEDLGYGFDIWNDPFQPPRKESRALLTGRSVVRVEKRGSWQREPGGELEYLQARLTVVASVAIGCGGGDNPWEIEVRQIVDFDIFDFIEGTSTELASYFQYSEKVFSVPSDCFYGDLAGRVCLDRRPTPQDGLKFPQTPISVSISGRTVTIFGQEHELAGGNWFGPGERPALVESEIDNFSAEFQITSRRSCVSAPCSCTAAAGTEWTFSNGTRSKTFTHGTDDVEWGGAPYYWSWDGVGYLVLEIFDPADYVPGLGGLVIERHTVQITCDTVDDVSTWMASVFSQCIQYDNVPQITHETYDEWAGVLECVPGCEDEHRAAGDPVLDGDLVDVEYLGRSTAVGTTECTPPPRISISVKQIATC